MKGSDASWLGDREQPDNLLDYSDDEQERLAKQKRRTKRQACDPAEDENTELNTGGLLC